MGADFKPMQVSTRQSVELCIWQQGWRVSLTYSFCLICMLCFSLYLHAQEECFYENISKERKSMLVKTVLSSYYV